MENTQENLVKKTCKELGITQKELAEKIGISEKTISGWANSKKSLPKYFLKVINLLQIEISYRDILRAIQRTDNLQITIKQ